MENKEHGLYCKNNSCGKLIAKINNINGVNALKEQINIIQNEEKIFVICPHCNKKNYVILTGGKLNNLILSHAEK